MKKDPSNWILQFPPIFETVLHLNKNRKELKDSMGGESLEGIKGPTLI